MSLRPDDRRAARTASAAVTREALAELRHELNRMIDRMDAFVREAAASLQAASEGRFHRQFLLEGVPGSFRTSATAINRARTAMAGTADRAAEAERARLRLADELESTVMTVAEQVAAVQSAAGEGTSTIETISRTVCDMDDLARGIATAVDGGDGGRAGRDARGLADMAERLRAEVSHFLTVMRGN
ncbi:hypothetical protein [Planobispora longispora]|uniref:Methyl-accepting chemotaxis protein n=1 Tax=Planobispora longispora TaxID=28887 RepID=A0A8J3W5C7_9ACTN|nr:hypothetical protein [Planobispora longispora]BFE86397.1 hypothetical protein GCM10020093_089980 [Planobispora longispora]GIH75721.1 hypothetical protein Plo01_21500 [Planobispora longispora]